MSDEYTLTTEDIEESFACGNRSIIATDIREENRRNIILFRQWLAAHNRELLEDVAREIEQMDFGPGQHTPFTAQANHKWGSDQAAKRIRKRIEKIT